MATYKAPPLLKTYLKVLGSTLLVLTLFPVLIVFFGLFFYERFSVQQIAMQAGLQLLCFTWVFAASAGLVKLWKEPTP